MCLRSEMSQNQTAHQEALPDFGSKLCNKTEGYSRDFVGKPCVGLRQSGEDRASSVFVADPMPGAGDSRLMTAIKTLHSNLGHPSSRSLARAIKLSGGSDEAVQAALAYRCPTCVRLQEPKQPILLSYPNSGNSSVTWSVLIYLPLQTEMEFGDKC